MLKKSFKGGKCKTSLKLAVARIKLLKNKREVQLRQMKRDLAKLLETGQEQTARIRVEHVVREEKTMAAYDLIEIYCELIVARLPIIESQKHCPVDLKEAVTSLVFAAPRCADVPELVDVRKHFTAKYGKEFITSALELRPDCGVNRQVVEKLSAIAPDGETKIKILTAIAKEHNVNWDRKDFEEKELKPPEDLLHGPITFGTDKKMAAEFPGVQPQPTPVQKYDSSINISGKRLSMNSQDHASTNTTSSMARPTTIHTQAMASVNGNKGTEFRDSSSEERNAFPMGKQNWKMEFKDATAAAQAAAESAERASMAAKAAAEFAHGGKDLRQYSPAYHESFDCSVRDEGSPSSAGPSFRGEHVNQDHVRMTYDSRTNSHHSVDRRMQNQHKERIDLDNQGEPGSTYHGYEGSNRRSGQSTPSGFTTALFDDERLVGDLPKTDQNNRKSSSEVESTPPSWQGRKTEKDPFHDEVRIHDQSSDDAEVESVDQRHNSKTTEYIGFPLEEEIRKHSSKSTSLSSRSNTDNDDSIWDSEMLNYGNDLGGYSFHKKTPKETRPPSFSDHSGVVIDEYVFDEDCNFDAKGGYNGHGSDSYAHSPGRKSPSHPSPRNDGWSPRKYMSGSTEENYGVKSYLKMESHSPTGLLERLSKESGPSISDDLLPVTFDDSDGLISESEEDIDYDKRSGRTDTTILPLKQDVSTRNSEKTKLDMDHGFLGSSFKEKENEEAYQKPWLRSSYDSSEDGSIKRNQETQVSFGGESEKSFSRHGSKKSSFKEKETAITNRKPRLPSSSDESDFEGIYENQDIQRDVRGEFRKQYGRGVAPTVKAFPGSTSSPRNRDEELGFEKQLHTSRVSSAKEDQAEDSFGVSKSPNAINDSGLGLNLGRLPGGLRNKVHTRRTRTGDPSSDASPHLTQLSTEAIPNFKSSTRFESRDPELHNQKAQVHNELSSRNPKTYFDSDSDDSEPPQRQTVRNKDYTSGKLTYRPRHSSKESDISNLSASVSESDAPVTSHIGKREKASKQNSYGSGSFGMPQIEKLRVESGEDPKWKESYKPVKEQSYMSEALPERSVSKEISSPRLQKTIPLVKNQLPKPISELETVAASGSNETLPKNISSRSAKTSKPSIPSEESTSTENSVKKPGHVHPKLPDYETLAAHFGSLRSNVRPSS